MKKLYHLIVAGFVAVVGLMPLHAFLSTWAGFVFGSALLFKSWKEVLLILLLPLVVILIVEKRQILRTIWSRNINKAVAVYFALHVFYAVFSQASIEAIAAGMMMNLRFLAVFLLAQVIFEASKNKQKIIEKYIPAGLIAAGLMLSVAAILQVFVLPKEFLVMFGYDKFESIAPYILVDDNPDALRAFATMRGPNTLGAFLILPLVLLTYYVYKSKNKLAFGSFLVLGGFALYLTGSRSAWIGFVVALGVLFVTLLKPDLLKRVIKYGTLPALILAGGLIYASINIPAVRLAVFHSSPGDEHLLEGSTEDHFAASTKGISRIIANPLGVGVGASGPASFYNQNNTPEISENYYVQIGREVGILGLLLFLYINYLLIKILWQRRAEFMPRLLLASFLGMAIVNLFLHGWADDPTAIMWWAVAGFVAFERPKPLMLRLLKR